MDSGDSGGLINLIKKIVADIPTSTTQSHRKTTSNKKTTRSKTTTKVATINQTERVQNILEKLQLFAKGTPPNNWSPSRFLYKVGALNLKDTFPFLVTNKE